MKNKSEIIAEMQQAQDALQTWEGYSEIIKKNIIVLKNAEHVKFKKLDCYIAEVKRTEFTKTLLYIAIDKDTKEAKAIYEKSQTRYELKGECFDITQPAIKESAMEYVKDTIEALKDTIKLRQRDLENYEADKAKEEKLAAYQKYESQCSRIQVLNNNCYIVRNGMTVTGISYNTNVVLADYTNKNIIIFEDNISSTTTAKHTNMILAELGFDKRNTYKERDQVEKYGTIWTIKKIKKYY